MSLTIYTLNDIREFEPCYDPNQHASENWAGTALDVLRAEHVSQKDRVWAAVRMIDDQTARQFAIHCARHALNLIETDDPLIIELKDMANRYTDGLATLQELSDMVAFAAQSECKCAEWSCAWSATAYAARSGVLKAAEGAFASAASAAGEVAVNTAQKRHANFGGYEPAYEHTQVVLIGHLIKMIEEQS